MLYLNKDLLVFSIGKDTYYLKNPNIKHGERIINKIQYSFIKTLSSPKTVGEVSTIIGFNEETVNGIFNLLNKGDIVRRDEDFIQPPKKSDEHFGMWIHTSNRCNLSCPYCYVNAEARGKIMDEEIWDTSLNKIIQTVKERNSKTFQMKIAGGEPLLTFHIWKEKVAYLREVLNDLGCLLKVQILTNGTILNDEIINFIKTQKAGIGISLDGFEEYHNITRQYRNGKGSFSKVALTIQTLQANNIIPYVTAVVTNENYEGLVPLTQYFLSQDIRFRFSLEKGILLNTEKILPYLVSSYSLIETEIDKGNYLHFLKHILCDLSLNKPIYNAPCGVGTRYGYISELGNIHVCQADSQNKPIGTIFDSNNLNEIIVNQQNFPKLLDIAPSCQVCQYKRICHGGCPVSKIESKSPFCEIFHLLLPTILKLRGKTILNLYLNSQKTSQALA